MVQFAVEGLRHQESEHGRISVPKGDRFAFYKLVDSRRKSPKDKDGHEQDFFDGIDTTLPGLASTAGRKTEKKVPWLRVSLTEILQRGSEAEKDTDVGLAAGITALLSGRKTADDLLQKVRQSSSSSKGARKVASRSTRNGSGDQFTRAVSRWAVELRALLMSTAILLQNGDDGPLWRKRCAASCSDLHVGARPFWAKLILDAPGCQRREVIKVGRQTFDSLFGLPATRPVTPAPIGIGTIPSARPWNTIDDRSTQRFPSPQRLFHVRMEYQDPPVRSKFRAASSGRTGTEGERPLAIGPEFSIELSPSSDVIPTDLRGSTSVKSTARDQGSASEAHIAASKRLACGSARNTPVHRDSQR